MARFFGIVGYGVPGEFVDGVWSDSITERAFSGELLSETRSLTPTENVNDDIQVNNRISIVADAFLLSNFLNIKYVEWAGSLWTVTSVTVERPRLILSLGGVYDGPRASTP